MEKITINKLEAAQTKAGKPYIKVHYNNGIVSCFNEADMDFFMKDVGVGGSVDVDISVNDKGYNQLNNINMDSAEKGSGNAPVSNAAMSNKDELIIAQVILKCANEYVSSVEDLSMEYGEALCNAVNELTGAYKLALSNLKAL